MKIIKKKKKFSKKVLKLIPTVQEFCEDYNKLREMSGNGILKTLTYQRLKLLEHKFDVHRSLNKSREQDSSVKDPKDFSNIVKVDTHIHLAAAMTPKHLFEFIKKKVKNHSSDVVYKDKEGKEVTLKEMFEKENIDIDSISVASLGINFLFYFFYLPFLFSIFIFIFIFYFLFFYLKKRCKS